MSKAWWTPLRLHRGEGRDESWLELFYDLVYVAILIQLGDRLSNNTDLLGIAAFVALFLPIWWSWTGITFYVNRFVVDDIPHRILIFVQIFFIAILGTTLDGAFGREDVVFVLSYVAIRLILVLLYLRTRKHAPEGWPLVRRYVIGFSMAGAIWLLSLLLPPPWRYVVWAIGMCVDFATPLIKGTRVKQRLLPPDNEHMSERYGTFTIIVLGEAFVKVIGEATGLDAGIEMLISGFFGLMIVAALWWIYFDDVAEAEIRDITTQRGSTYIWLYSHLPLAIAITGFGVAIKKLVLHPSGMVPPDKYRWLASGAIALALLFVSAIDMVTTHREGAEGEVRARYNVTAAILIILLPLTGLPLQVYIGILAFLTIAPIVADITTEKRGFRKERDDEQT